MTKLTAVIIDDEPLAHNVIQTYVDNVSYVEVVERCYSATQALNYLSQHTVDLLFLDINMPMLSGLDLLKVLKQKPLVIITSAYQEHALESFELDVTDYLLKPFSFERFLQACNKCRDQFQLIQQAKDSVAAVQSQQPETVFIKVDKKQLQVNISDISHLEAYGNYVKVWRNGSSVLTPRTLSSFEEQLPEAQFMRIHKSTIINLDQIDYVEGTVIRLLSGEQVTIGKSYKSLVQLKLN